MRDFLAFRLMITPGMIMIVWLLGALALLALPLAAMASAPPDGAPPVEHRGFFVTLTPLMALAIALIGNVVWRVWCEQLMVFFAIHRALLGGRQDKGITATARL